MPAPAVCGALYMTDVWLGVRALVAGGVWRADVPAVDDAASRRADGVCCVAGRWCADDGLWRRAYLNASSTARI